MAFTAIAPLTALQSQGIFVGFRKAEYSFIQTIVTFARIGIVPFLTAFGALGIYASYGLTPILAFLLGFFLISRVCEYRPFPSVKREVINDLFHFSFGNYIARIFRGLPALILPIIVVNMLGAEANAYFFIAWTIFGVILGLSHSVLSSLHAEGAHSIENLKANATKALKIIFLLLMFATFIIFLAGRNVLWLFSETYSENSYEILLLLTVAVIPQIINDTYVTVERIYKNIRPIIIVFLVSSSLTLVMSYILITPFGILGIGYAKIAAECTVSLFSCPRLRYLLSKMK
ncbi:MAG: hypothetical protein DRO65_03885 [Candidatus Altiarchaeales archaeon]|nr:MAG: hypothetical protein DRO65_03885 [Candidatus Altiarchaeales archaeon]